MANRFKDYRAQLKSNKTVVLSEDELALYSKTTNNEGVSHTHEDWVAAEKQSSIIGEDDYPVEFSEKEKTIARDLEREQKAKSHNQEAEEAL